MTTLNFCTLLSFADKVLTHLYTWFLKSSFRSFGRRSRIGFGAKLPQPHLIEIGDSVFIGEQAWLNAKNICGDGRTTLRIGRGSYIGRFVQINAWLDVVIEDDVLIADRVFISDADHNYGNLEMPIRHQGDRFKGGVLIGAGAWVGIGAVILPGVTLGKHSIVAANAVVTKSVPDFAIAGGVPARLSSFKKELVMNLKNRIYRLTSRLLSIPHRINKIQEALGRIEQRQVTQMNVGIKESEFRVYSQWGEDGIIQYIVNRIPIPNKTFVEFGVENYTESNTRFLLINNNWSGLVIDGSPKNIEYIKYDSIYWSHNVKAECEFITVDNINEIFLRNGIKGDIGLLSVDIDGNDYWVWESINCIQPRIVVAEYNSLFGAHAKVSTPYRPDFYRGDAHHSKVYYGASISALSHLARQKGYSLVGSNLAGNNVFFVRNDLLGTLKVFTPEEAYKRAQFREFNNEHGKLTYYDFDARFSALGDMEVQDVETNKLIRISDLCGMSDVKVENLLV